MERLSGLDASFLYLESQAQLMHVVGIVEVDPSTIPGGYRFAAVRAEIGRRITAMPAFRRKLHDSLFNLDHPVWIEDREFDIERHVHQVALPAPGGERELTAFCAHMAGQPLDRGRPLWEIWVIEGRPDGRLAVMIRMHHASVDGVSGAELLTQLCSLTPEAPDLDADRQAMSAGGASLPTLALNGALNVVRRPISVAQLLPQTVEVPFRWLLRARRSAAMPMPFSAPRTSFNGTITPHREIAFTQVSMSDIKRIKDQFGVKVNDVVLAVCAGALRRYLDDRGELPDRPLVAMVPVSLHGEDDDGRLVTKGTNKVTGMFASLPTDIDDPVDRVFAVAERSKTAKDHHGSIEPNLLRAWSQLLPSNTVGALMRFYAAHNLAEHHPVIYNLVISNVPGPDFPLYFLGAEITGMYPLGPVFHGAGLNMTVFSAAGSLNVGLMACKELVEDPWHITRAVEADVKALVEACDS